MEDDLKKYSNLIKDYIYKNYQRHFQKPIPGKFEYPFFTSGINYVNQIWDWGSWQSSIAFRSINDPKLEECQKGVILNFLNAQEKNGKLPIVLQTNDANWLPKDSNIFKPVLSQHVLEICRKYKDFKWIANRYNQLKKFINYYDNYQYHKESELYFWIDDFAIGVDNDPAVFYRHNKSTGSIFLNALMYRELLAISVIAKHLKHKSDARKFLKKAKVLKDSIRRECYDPIDGFYYSVDISLKPINPKNWLHSGHPRFWHSLPIKIKSWSSMMALWAGIASKKEAESCIKNLLDKNGLYSNYGVRSLAKNEKMYCEVDTGNPSCWLGPIWINANYFTYIALRNYGYDDLAIDLAKKIIRLLGKDLEENGGFHEYYNSNTGKGIRGLGMHGWNFLILELIKDIE